MAGIVESDVSHPLVRELLNQFLIGVHRRGEELSAHDLKTLVDQLDVEPELATELVSFIEPALGLLDDYDRYCRVDPDAHTDTDTDTDVEDDDDEDDGSGVEFVGDTEVAPGILVI